MRAIITLILFLLLGYGGWILYQNYYMYLEKHEIISLEVPGNQVATYLRVGRKYNISWTYLAAMDEVNSKYEKITLNTVDKNAKYLRSNLVGKETIPKVVQKILLKRFSKEKVDKMMYIATSYQWEAASLDKLYLFPFSKDDRKQISYGNSWGEARTYGRKRKHEGIDLMALKGTPIIAVTDGKVIRKGWNELGGWSISIQDKNYPYIFYYYAHLSKYNKNISIGSSIKKGQVLGFVGDSGYGEEGTTGKFPPHLHFGVYVFEGLQTCEYKAINPYAFLKVWDLEK